MSENIGKITVVIEAQTKELKEGLKTAETAVKQSGDNIVASQDRTTSSIKSSWTELSNKISVVTTGLSVAENSFNAVGSVIKIFGDDSTSAIDKVGGSLLAIGDAGIPIVSDFINVGVALASVFVDVQGAIEDAEEAARNLARSTQNFQLAMNLIQDKRGQEAGIALTKMQLNLLEMQLAPAEEMTAQVKEQMLMQEERMKLLALETTSQQKITELKKAEMLVVGSDVHAENSRKRLKIAIKEEEKFNQIRQGLVKEEYNIRINAITEIADKEDEFAKRNAERERERLARNTQKIINDAKAVAQKTQSLEDRLAIMKAKNSGDEEKARKLAIESRYRKEMANANDKQKELLLQMKELDLAGASGAGAGASASATASISTAVGSFTVATGQREIKKQTSLLKRIADSNEKVAEKLSQPSASGIVAATG